MFSRKQWVGGTSAAVFAAACALITPWEGMRTNPYLDIVGVPTVCLGETKVPMRTYTVPECKAMLREGLKEYDDGMKRCVTRDMPDSVHVAFLSATYNIGVKGFCGSSMARHANAGDWFAACDALLNWNKAGGKVVRGLDNRRKAEHQVCVRDLER